MDISLLLFLSVMLYGTEADVSSDGVIMPTKCEVCKIMVIELQSSFDETGKSKEVLRTGHGLDPDKKKAIDYRKSDLRLIEAMHEPHVCKRVLQYNLHKERKGSLRFAKGRSQTMDVLHGLKDKGVKVELGIPYELWDSTSVEVAQMQRLCDSIVENHEEDIEEWYYHHQDQPLIDYLCRDRVLRKDETECLDEVFVPEVENKEEEEKKEEKKEKKTKKKSKKNLKGEETPNGAPEKAKVKSTDTESSQKKEEL